MEFNDFLLIIAALAPAVVLCIYVFVKDRAEKEPISLLLWLFFYGIVICFPAGKLELWLGELIKKIFMPFMYEQNGQLYLEGIAFNIYSACDNFIGVALIEEGLKWIVLIIVAKTREDFNSLFDGIIYAVFISLGFAAYENVLYVLENGWMTALMRGIMSVPGHMSDAVIMGYYFSLWHMHCLARNRERIFKKEGLISITTKEFPTKRYFVLSIILPVLSHGLYDYCASVGGDFELGILVAFIVAIYIYSFGKIRQVSAADMIDNSYVSLMMYGKHPQAVEKYLEKIETSDKQ